MEKLSPLLILALSVHLLNAAEPPQQKLKLMPLAPELALDTSNTSIKKLLACVRYLDNSFEERLDESEPEAPLTLEYYPYPALKWAQKNGHTPLMPHLPGYVGKEMATLENEQELLESAIECIYYLDLLLFQCTKNQDLFGEGVLFETWAAFPMFSFEWFAEKEMVDFASVFLKEFKRCFPREKHTDRGYYLRDRRIDAHFWYSTSWEKFLWTRFSVASSGHLNTVKFYIALHQEGFFSKETLSSVFASPSGCLISNPAYFVDTLLLKPLDETDREFDPWRLFDPLKQALCNSTNKLNQDAIVKLIIENGIEAASYCCITIIHENGIEADSDFCITETHEKCDSSMTPLQMAIAHKCTLDTFLYLASRERLDRTTGCTGDSLLHLAVLAGAFDIVASLLTLSKVLELDLLKSRNFVGETPLLLTKSHASPEIAKLLIEAGASLEEKDLEGNTLLHKVSFAIKPAIGINSDIIERWANLKDFPASNILLVSFILEEGADTKALNRLGGTPLMNALIAGRPDVVQLVLDKDRAAKFDSTDYFILACVTLKGWYAAPPCTYCKLAVLHLYASKASLQQQAKTAKNKVKKTMIAMADKTLPQLPAELRYRILTEALPLELTLLLLNVVGQNQPTPKHAPVFDEKIVRKAAFVLSRGLWLKDVKAEEGMAKSQPEYFTSQFLSPYLLTLFNERIAPLKAN